MSADPHPKSVSHVYEGRRSPAARFVRAFLKFSGKKGLVAAVLVVLGGVLEGAGLLLLIPILGAVLRTGSGGGAMERAGAAVLDALPATTAFGKLSLLLALFAALMAFRGFIITTRDVKLARLRIGFVNDKRTCITQHLASARWEAIARLRHARISHLMSSDIQSVGVAAHFLLQGTTAMVMLAAQCILAFLLAPELAVLSISLLLVGGVALIPVLRRARAMGQYVTGANLSLMNTTTQFLGGLKLAVSQNLQNRFVAEYGETLGHLGQRQVQYLRQQSLSNVALTTLAAGAGALTILIGVGVLGTAPGVMITFLLVLGRMTGPASIVQQGAQQFANSLPAFEKLEELEAELASAARPEAIAAVPARDPLEGAIEFHDVSFRHAASEDAEEIAGLSGLTLAIAPGSFVGVTGPSGAGKTTFADLLTGLFAPQHGLISVGGTSLEGAPLLSWRNAISYISQDPFLFHDTVRKNLAWAAPDASDTEIWDALKLTGADGIVCGMAEGLETIVGERGTLISGGERQRLALARAILRKPRLLVLDEATNAIDIPGEHAILERMGALQPRATIVLIAHRPESLALCERVVVLQRGRLFSDGPYDAQALRGH